MSYQWTVPYLVADDFLPEAILGGLVEAAQQAEHSMMDPIVARYRAHADTYMGDGSLLSNVHSQFAPCMVDWLEQLAPEKLRNPHYFKYDLVATLPDYVHSKHVDIEDKLLSVVVYLAPDLSLGTLLYDRAGTSVQHIIGWRVNRAFVFSRNEHTHHQYLGFGDSPRYTLGLNIMAGSEFKDYRII